MHLRKAAGNAWGIARIVFLNLYIGQELVYHWLGIPCQRDHILVVSLILTATTFLLALLFEIANKE